MNKFAIVSYMYNTCCHFECNSNIIGRIQSVTVVRAFMGSREIASIVDSARSQSALIR